MLKADDMNNQPVTKTKALYAEIDEKLLKQLKIQCAMDEKTVREVTEKLVAGYLAGKFTIE